MLRKDRVLLVTCHERMQRVQTYSVLCPNLGARRGWAVSTTTRPLYPLYRRLGWFGCVLAKRKSLPPTGDRAADRTALSKLLY
jgi:hypothetical protein